MWSDPTCRSLKGCRRSPRGSLALLSRAWVCGMLVRVHLKVLVHMRTEASGEIQVNDEEQTGELSDLRPTVGCS